MSEQPINTASLANRRKTRRLKISSHARAECRKGAYGMGPNVAVSTLDLSQNGDRLIVRVGMTSTPARLGGVGAAPVKVR